MRICSTPWHILVLLLTACSSSHGVDECPDVLGTCVDACCNSSGRPTFDDACNPTCPDRTFLIDRCAPAPGCIDDCPVSDDAGVDYCMGGPCCNEERDPIMNADCSYSCPAGFSFSCIADPDARCAPPWMTCETTSDCGLAPEMSCCFVCGEPTLANVHAINVGHREEYFLNWCEPPAACPECLTIDNPDLVATCAAGLCDALDVRSLELSACTEDTDCALRVTECCECGGDVSRLIAIRTDAAGAYAALVCDPGTACDACVPIYPAGTEAFCAPDGHCDVR